jgi:hypothetical protein
MGSSMRKCLGRRTVLRDMPHIFPQHRMSSGSLACNKSDNYTKGTFELCAAGFIYTGPQKCLSRSALACTTRDDHTTHTFELCAAGFVYTGLRPVCCADCTTACHAVR